MILTENGLQQAGVLNDKYPEGPCLYRKSGLKFQKIIFEREIEKIMRDLHHTRARLVVRFEAGKDSCRSEVVAIDSKSGVLGVSPFVDKHNGERIMPPRDKLTIATVVGGMECLFETSIAYKATTRAAHEINFPKVLQYQQKRSAYRVDTRTARLQINCVMDQKSRFGGKVIDISATGARFIFENKRWVELVPEGSLIKQCRIDLPMVGTVEFSAKARFKGEIGEGEPFLGIEIQNIDNANQTKLERYIRMRDIELRRESIDIDDD